LRVFLKCFFALRTRFFLVLCPDTQTVFPLKAGFLPELILSFRCLLPRPRPLGVRPAPPSPVPFIPTSMDSSVGFFLRSEDLSYSARAQLLSLPEPRALFLSGLLLRSLCARPPFAPSTSHQAPTVNSFFDPLSPTFFSAPSELFPSPTVFKTFHFFLFWLRFDSGTFSSPPQVRFRRWPPVP